jgi:hypothetical protein
MIVRVLLAILLFASAAQAESFNRADWGIFEKGTREKVISANTVQRVRDFYTGDIVPAEAITLDHVVSVKEAWELGGSTWTVATMHKFYNDTDNLVPTMLGVNASKGDSGRWLPEINREKFLEKRHLICGRYGLNCAFEGPK